MEFEDGGRPFRHHGRTGPIIRLSLVNLLLNIVTLSFWRFWAKTRVRRFLWGNTTAWGDPVEYTGTGRELLLGFLVAIVAVFLPWMIAAAYAQSLVEAGQAWAVLAVFLLQCLLIMLAGAGLYRARRYQLSRTLWRGIRGGQDGEAWRYGILVLFTGFGVALSLGWALPWAQVTLARYKMGNTRLGDQRFTCDAVSRPLYKRFAVAWVVAALLGPTVFSAIVSLFVVREGTADVDTFLLASLAALAGLLVVAPFILLPYAWYRAAFYARLAQATGFAGARFAFESKSWDLVWLIFNNLLLTILSLGILKPWAALRVFRFACRHLQVLGRPDFERVHQGAAQRGRTGEGLATVFDGAGDF